MAGVVGNGAVINAAERAVLEIDANTISGDYAIGNGRLDSSAGTAIRPHSRTNTVPDLRVLHYDSGSCSGHFNAVAGEPVDKGIRDVKDIARDKPDAVNSGAGAIDVEPV